MKSHQYYFETTHIVQDSKSDMDNLHYNEMHKRTMPVHFVIKFVLSNKHKVLRINTSGEENSNCEHIRYFDGRILKQFLNGKLEKRFRKKPPIPKESSDVIPTSHVRYATDDEGVYFKFNIFFFIFNT